LTHRELITHQPIHLPQPHDGQKRKRKKEREKKKPQESSPQLPPIKYMAAAGPGMRHVKFRQAMVSDPQ